MAEAAVAPVPHEIKGSAIYAFVTVKVGVQSSDALKKDWWVMCVPRLDP